MPFFKLKDLKEPHTNKVKVKQKTIKKMIIKLLSVPRFLTRISHISRQPVSYSKSQIIGFHKTQDTRAGIAKFNNKSQ